MIVKHEGARGLYWGLPPAQSSISDRNDQTIARVEDAECVYCFDFEICIDLISGVSGK